VGGAAGTAVAVPLSGSMATQGFAHFCKKINKHVGDLVLLI